MHHAAIIVSDYGRSREFYVEKLGFPVLRENFRQERGDWKLDLKFGEGELEIFAIPGAPPRPGPTIPRPEACGTWPSRWKTWRKPPGSWRSGASPASPSAGTLTRGGRMTFFHDPDGLPLELHE